MIPVTTIFVLVSLITISQHGGLVDCFSTGAPDNSCKDPSAFHTRKINATHEGIILSQPMVTNPFRLVTKVTSFTPGEEIAVSLVVNNPRTVLKGFFIEAVQANIGIRDLRREAFGLFRNVTSRERPSTCQSPSNIRVGGITHNDSGPKQNVTVIWVAPSEYDPGNVQFLATGVQEYDMYWTDIRSDALESKGYQVVNDNVKQTSVFSPTALWYIWLHNLRQQLSHGHHNHNHTSQMTL